MHAAPLSDSLKLSRNNFSHPCNLWTHFELWTRVTETNQFLLFPRHTGLDSVVDTRKGKRLSMPGSLAGLVSLSYGLRPHPAKVFLHIWLNDEGPFWTFEQAASNRMYVWFQVTKSHTWSLISGQHKGWHPVGCSWAKVWKCIGCEKSRPFDQHTTTVMIDVAPHSSPAADAKTDSRKGKESGETA